MTHQDDPEDDNGQKDSGQEYRVRKIRRLDGVLDIGRSLQVKIPSHRAVRGRVPIRVKDFTRCL